MTCKNCVLSSHLLLVPASASAVFITPSLSLSHSLSFWLFLYSGVVNEYVKQVRQLACQLLDMVGEGLGLQDTRVLSRLLQDSENDSLVRLNHYPPWPGSDRAVGDADREPAGGKSRDKRSGGRIGFGEHSDPQILSILRSNDVDGLQILSAQAEDGGVWIPVPADPAAFYVIVGDALQVSIRRLCAVRIHRFCCRLPPRQDSGRIYASFHTSNSYPPFPRRFPRHPLIL
ncbi:hypothetical protein BHE74_00021588 [Ensete ventricosum]|nr:hypothetical protein GW17_00004207 [Ensete ventricosum]RWW70731.1 hypothetical protein BHE74_00021588 [Ensete ventricosum]RZR97618.1 hypothetical protein BHM03_00026847 [Ensete ventricosum]